MTSTATRTAPNLGEKLADARSEAERIRVQLLQAEADLSSAVGAADYAAADQAKARVEKLRPLLVAAVGQEQALKADATAVLDAIAELDAKRQAEQEEAQRRSRQDGAQRTLQGAMAGEREAQETALRHLAEAMAGIDAVRASLAAAKFAEQEGNAARWEAAQARAVLDGTEQAQFTVSPTWASGRIDRSALLTAILRGYDLD